MALTFVDLIPVFLVFILYFMGMPIVYSLFGATFFYFLVIDTTSKPWLILQKVMNSTQSFSLLAILVICAAALHRSTCCCPC